jgi:hypothetical protein
MSFQSRDERELLKREEKLEAEEKLRKEGIKKLAEVHDLLVQAGYFEPKDEVTFCPFCGSTKIVIGEVSFDVHRFRLFTLSSEEVERAYKSSEAKPLEFDGVNDYPVDSGSTVSPIFQRSETFFCQNCGRKFKVVR